MWIGKNSLPAGGVPLQSGRGPQEFHRSFVWRPPRHILFSPLSRSVSRGHVCSKDPPVRSADAPVPIGDIDPTLAKALPRNFRTTDDQLKASDGKTPSINGLIDLHASGSENLALSGL
jgi:hypothetical protein